MADEKSGLVDLEDLTAAALAGVGRALAARQIGPKGHKWPWEGPILIGIVAYPDREDFPVFGTSAGGAGQPAFLTVPDHTTIMEYLLTNPLPVLKELGLIEDKTRKYTPETVLAAIEKTSSSADVKRIAAMTLQTLKGLENPNAQADRVTQTKLKRLGGQLGAAGSIDEQLKVLASARADTSDNPGFLIGVETAIAILKDGRNSIYNPDFYRGIFGESDGSTAIAKDAGGEIGGADAEGAVGGAVAVGAAGMLGGPVGSAAGIAAGAVAGGIGASAGKVVGLLLDWLF